MASIDSALLIAFSNCSLMNAFSFSKHHALGIAIALILFCAGCATQRIDWASRIGNYTFDQTVIELGPPDKQAKLQDGTIIADWLTRRGYTYTQASPVYGYPYSFGGPAAAVISDTSPNFYLRLTFGTDGKLKAWKKFAK